MTQNAISNLTHRSSGLFLHPISLPSPHGIGDLGQEAYRFVDFLKQSKQSLWQMCPVGPVDYGHSPYQSPSAFAGNPLLIDLRAVLRTVKTTRFPARINYDKVKEFKNHALKEAFHKFTRSKKARWELQKFMDQHRHWIKTYCRFMAFKRHFENKPWWKWPVQIKLNTPKDVDLLSNELKSEIEFQAFQQYLFHQQWKKLKTYAEQNHVALIGDIPFYVALDSADVWSHPDQFLLDKNKNVQCLAGVPPDSSHLTGQRWGTPLYRWNKMKNSGYDWWMNRLKKAFQHFDVLRLDHFIGFERSWAVKAGQSTAATGKWIKGPGSHFFHILFRTFSPSNIIVEDLGSLTPAVETLRDDFNLSGMKILQVAFETHQGAEVNRPYQFSKNSVVYTGSHDNDTTKGWFHSLKDSPRQDEKQLVQKYLKSNSRQIHWDMIRLASSTPCQWSLIPLQDVLGLGPKARLNKPGSMAGAWEWRFTKKDLRSSHKKKLAKITRLYGRERTPL